MPNETTSEILERMEAYAENDLKTFQMSALPNPEPEEEAMLAAAAQHLADIKELSERLAERRREPGECRVAGRGGERRDVALTYIRGAMQCVKHATSLVHSAELSYCANPESKVWDAAKQLEDAAKLLSKAGSHFSTASTERLVREIAEDRHERTADAESIGTFCSEARSTRAAE